jgi:hypothetical protein
MQEQTIDAQTQVYEELATCIHAMKFQQKVHAFLFELRYNIDECHILHKSCTLLLLRVTQEASPLGHVKDVEGYVEDTKVVVQAKKDYTGTQNYVTKAPTSRQSLYHLRKIQVPRYTSPEAP